MARPIIDLHSHWFDRPVLDRLRRRSKVPRIALAEGQLWIESTVGRLPLDPQWTDIDHRLAHLDRHNVVHQLLSWPTTLGLEPAMDFAEAADFWRAVNNGYAALVRRHSDRFSALAVVSTEDPVWSATELRRSHEELGLIGLVLPINVFGSVAGVRYLRPLLAEAQRLGSHLYLHTGYGAGSVPGQPTAVERPESGALGWTLAAAHHFASAFATVALTDALDDYPDITIQIAMLGGAGAAALLAEQVVQSPGRFGEIGLNPARLDRIWLDTGALGHGPAAIAATVDVLGRKRVVFGSDYAPAADIGMVLDQVSRASIDRAAHDAILFDNGRALLARHGRKFPAAAVVGGTLVGI